ncbi:MAG: helix-turn-helix transcriptional regulator [Betaproteobacteria bacterium]|nr:helix-turn-helix transcriptional regulator [Betaproteobacteria bacterium]
MSITELFAQNVRELRMKRGFSQEELAHRAGLHRTYVGAVERGERNITLLNAQRIAEALGVTLDRCVRLNDEKRRKQTSKRS